MQGAQVFLDEDEGLNDEIMFRHLVPGECFSYFYYLLTFIIGNNDDEQQQDRRRKGPNDETLFRCLALGSRHIADVSQAPSKFLFFYYILSIY